jgi:hypothetical protein
VRLELWAEEDVVHGRVELCKRKKMNRIAEEEETTMMMKDGQI